MGANIWAVVAVVVASASGTAQLPSVTEVPLTFRDRQPFIPVRTAGHSFLLQLDLGADDDLGLTAAALRAVRLESVAGTSRHQDIKGHLIQERRFQVPELQIGGLILHDVQGTEQMDDPSFHRPLGWEGHIGQNLLKAYAVAVDYRAKRLTLSGNSGEGRCTGNPVSFLPEWKGQAVTTVKTDLGPLTLFWDTGAPVTLVHSERLGVNLDHLTSQHFVMEEVDFGPVELVGFEFSQPPGIDGFVGYNFFAVNGVCFDFPQSRLLVRR